MQGNQLPDVPNDLQDALMKAARKVNAEQPLKRLVIVAAVMYENAKLVDEVNRLRAELGREPIPVYNPLNGKKNG